MNTEQQGIAAEYARASEAGKVRWLAGVAHNLTNSARGQHFDYRNHAAVAVEKLLAINELQDHISGMIVQALDRLTERYPDDLFIEILFDIAAKAEIADELQWAFTAAREPAVALK